MPRSRWLQWVAFAALLAFGIIRGHPLMVVCLAAAPAVILLPAWYGLHRPFARDRARRSKGLCTRCGYDLRGNVSGVCPEMFSVL
jgi:hypothetical protein